MVDKASVDDALKDFGNKIKVGNRAVAGEIIDRKGVFLWRGVTTACLKGRGKVDSEMERFMRVKRLKTRTSRHDLRRTVGIKSREQVALEEEKIADRTSAMVAGRKDERRGGGALGGR